MEELLVGMMLAHCCCVEEEEEAQLLPLALVRDSGGTGGATW